MRGTLLLKQPAFWSQEPVQCGLDVYIGSLRFRSSRELLISYSCSEPSSGEINIYIVNFSLKDLEAFYSYLLLYIKLE